jgi:Zn ribbon nucleic-acid-binding protein
MWNLFNCYLSGRHDYGMWCEPGVMFLRCVHCGKRSSGWAVTPTPVTVAQRAPIVHAKVAQARTPAPVAAARPQVNGHVIPFGEARRSAPAAKTGRAAAR